MYGGVWWFVVIHSRGLPVSFKSSSLLFWAVSTTQNINFHLLTTTTTNTTLLPTPTVPLVPTNFYKPKLQRKVVRIKERKGTGREQKQEYIHMKVESVTQYVPVFFKNPTTTTQNYIPRMTVGICGWRGDGGVQFYLPNTYVCVATWCTYMYAWSNGIHILYLQKAGHYNDGLE